MWQFFTGLSLTLCLSATLPSDDNPAEPSVLVECFGRLRDGVMAVGGETTGTTIAFNQTVWELRLPDDASREFAKNHHKQSVKVIGRLKKIMGTETKVRWVVEVKTLTEGAETRNPPGARMIVYGVLQANAPRKAGLSEFTIEADDQSWPVDLSSDVRLQTAARSLVGQQVVLAGSVEQDKDKESPGPVYVRVRTLRGLD